VQHTEMLASQWKSPLQPEQRNEYASQQWPADIIHQGNFLHSQASSRCDFITAEYVPAMMS
jgi:hypothetical protein